MGTAISTGLDGARLFLGQENYVGNVFAGATGKNIKTIFSEAKALKGSTAGNIIRTVRKEVDLLENALDWASKNFNKAELKAMKRSAGNQKNYMQNIIKEFTKQNADDAIGATVKNAGKAVGKATSSGGISSLFGTLKKSVGKNLGVVLSVAFELPEIIKAFKNGDGIQQIGRSALNVGGFAAGAAAGAAIGSFIPGAGTLIGGIAGGLCGIVGSMLGGGVTDKIGKKIFGESIEDKKVAQQEALEEQALQQQQMQALQSMQPQFNPYGFEAPQLSAFC